MARSGSFALVGERLARDEEYLGAVKEHILGMIDTKLTPKCIYMIFDVQSRRKLGQGNRALSHTPNHSDEA